MISLLMMACGGLFCANTPVDQAGEKILFIQDADTVTAHVQIQYQGDAKDFSWVVPVPTEPTLGVGSDQVFQQLRSVTQPRFQLAYRTEGTCFSSVQPGTLSSATGSIGHTSAGLVSEGQVGPFDSAILKPDDAGALKAWLKANAYVIPDKLDPLLDPYVAGKYYFVALKLTKDRSAGDIQPITLKYKATKPGVPIRLTGVAAIPNMAVYVWVLGDARAVPENYRHAVINPARINWLTGGANYAQVVTQAVAEAGGQAFVTDFAGDAAPAAQQLGNPNLQTSFLAGLTDPDQFRTTVSSQVYFGTNFGRQQAFLARYAPPGATKVDTAAAIAELETTVVKPIQDLKEQFGRHGYLTQLFTTMSPAQMTQDPTFRFNPDLPKVEAVHQATLLTRCSWTVTVPNAPRSLEFADGSWLPLSNNGDQVKAVDLPASLRIEQLKEQGAPAVIVD
ncbi:MAG: hypothetical protein JWM80_6312, partial [Cyanobacteria bacterium RYN_339]|nr:hypothetical protein [Cyanobacteria bacterium RYN_339]